jgi:hypothetical protein
MKLGIKTGLKGNSKADLEAARPDFCEIWFDSRKPEAYTDLFQVIKNVGCEVGLHFWGALSDNTLANLSYPDGEVLKASKVLVKTTIDVAAKNHCWYVNVHPGGALLSIVNFEKEEFKSYGIRKEFADCALVLGQSLMELGQYALERGVQLLVESVPKLAIGTPWHGPSGRFKPVDLAELPIEYLKPFVKAGNVSFTNDFGHTAANLDTPDRGKIAAFLFDTTQELAPYTKLIHTGYVIPPYNGTDYHGCLYYDEFKTLDAIPNYDEMQKLLRLFENRTDIGALVEPATDHPKNFAFLKQLIQSLT